MKNRDFILKLNNEFSRLSANCNQKCYSPKPDVLSEPLVNQFERQILMSLYFFGPMNLSNLGQLTALNSSFIGRATDKLKEKELILKQRVENDHRIFHIKLTEYAEDLSSKQALSYKNNLEQRLISKSHESSLPIIKEKLVIIVDVLKRYAEGFGIWKKDYIQNSPESDIIKLIGLRACALHSIYTHMDKSLDSFKNRESINEIQRTIIYFLVKNGTMSISELSKTTGLKLKYVSDAAIILAEKGLVQKFHLNGNNRTRYINLTDKCKKGYNDQESFECEFLHKNFNAMFTDDELDSFLNAHCDINNIFDEI